MIKSLRNRLKPRNFIILLMATGIAIANEASNHKQEISADLKSVGFAKIKQFQIISFKIEYTNLTRNEIVIFPSEYGKLLGIFTPIFISGRDTIRVYPVSDVDYFCYPGDTIPPFKKIQREITLWKTSRIWHKSPKIKNMKELFSLPLDKAAIEYNLDVDFDTIGSKEMDAEKKEQLSEYKACGKYLKTHFLTEFRKIQR